MGMFNNVLVVCAGNICRSPTGEYLLKKAVAEKGINVTSAGLTALEGKPADAMAQKIANHHGVDMSAHKGRQLSSQIIAENDVILVMEQRHIDDIRVRYPQASGKTFLLGKWIDNAEIPDPYRQSEEAFIHVYELIERACTAWQKYL
jgi:protein-tyrosine phosphatase